MYEVKQRDERHIINQRCRLKQTGYGDLLFRSEPWGSYKHSLPHRNSTYTHVCENPLPTPKVKPCSKGSSRLTTHSDPQNTGGLSHPRFKSHLSHHSKWSQNHTPRETLICICMGERLGIPPVACVRCALVWPLSAFGPGPFETDRDTGDPTPTLTKRE